MGLTSLLSCADMAMFTKNALILFGQTPIIHCKYFIGGKSEVKAVIRIAICDDEERAVALHEKIVEDSLQIQGIGCEITTYTQSRNLLVVCIR